MKANKRKNNPGKRKHLILLLFLYPYIVGYTPDSTGTSNSVLDVLFGFGQHAVVMYDCSGNATSINKYAAIDYGVNYSHYFNDF